jgi:transglutaminase-like putative cysteine protease
MAEKYFKTTSAQESGTDNKCMKYFTGFIVLVALMLNWLAEPMCSPASSAPDESRWDVLACFERAARIDYHDEGEEDYWQSPAETLDLGRGDCEDKALLLRNMLARRGIEARVSFGVEDTTTSPNLHAWVECEIEGELYVLDPTGGYIARREDLPPTRHMPVLNMPSVLRKLREYRRRTGDTEINEYYEYVLDRSATGGN